MTGDFEDYYGTARVGSLACVQRIDSVYGQQFIFARVLDSSGGKIKTLYGTFWTVNGERIDNRWNSTDNRLVVPTIARIEAEEANLASLYQFGTDRKFELAAARAVLERRATKMPNVPPPPIPTLEEAEAELRDATAYWMSVDQLLDSPSNSIRARREASERLAAAKTSLQLATKLHVSIPKKPNRSEIRSAPNVGQNTSGQTSEKKLRPGSMFGSKFEVRYVSTYNNIDKTSYIFNVFAATNIKRN